MKKKAAIVILLCILMIAIIVGVFIHISARNMAHKDSEIIDLLDSDEVVPEFVLQGSYYMLPCSLNDFLENGWKLYGKVRAATLSEFGYTYITVSKDNLLLKPGEYVESTIRWEESTDLLKIMIANLTQEDCGMTEGQVIHVEMGTSWGVVNFPNQKEFNRFVIKKGINLGTSNQQAEELLKSMPGFYISKEEYLLSSFDRIGIKQDSTDIYSVLLRQGHDTNLFSISSNDIKRVQIKRIDAEK